MRHSLDFCLVCSLGVGGLVVLLGCCTSTLFAIGTNPREEEVRMLEFRRVASDAASLIIAALYLFAGQAHFTDKLTPEFAQHIEAMTQNSYTTLNFLDLDYLPVSQAFSLAFPELGRMLTRPVQTISWCMGSCSSSLSVSSTGQDIRLGVGCGWIFRRPIWSISDQPRRHSSHSSPRASHCRTGFEA